MRQKLHEALTWSRDRFVNNETIILYYTTDEWGKEDCQYFYTPQSIESIVRPAITTTIANIEKEREVYPHQYRSFRLDIKVCNLDQSITELTLEKIPAHQEIYLTNTEISLKFGGFMQTVDYSNRTISFYVSDLTDKDTKRYCGIEIWNNWLVRL
jgi:hypothetical protein